MHVKIDKSRGDSLRGVGRNSILEGWEGDQCASTDSQAVPVFYCSYVETVFIWFGGSINNTEDMRKLRFWSGWTDDEWRKRYGDKVQLDFEKHCQPGFCDHEVQETCLSHLSHRVGMLLFTYQGKDWHSFTPSVSPNRGVKGFSRWKNGVQRNVIEPVCPKRCKITMHNFFTNSICEKTWLGIM